jgi:tetratricopeptide (TPR) repeat protein
MSNPMSAPAISRFERLSAFLRQDPTNLRLTADAADAAFDEERWPEAADLIARYAAREPLPPRLVNVAGLLALHESRFSDAIDLFGPLLGTGPQDPHLRLNLAWAKAMVGEPAAVIDLIDDDVVAIAPTAAALKVQALHRLGRLDEALSTGGAYAARWADDKALMSALAVAALDAEDVDLARAYAARAGDTHEGLSTVGAIAFDQGLVSEATRLFDRALAIDPSSGRALLGKGLALLANGDPVQGTVLIEDAAKSFDYHLGSWIAVGWGYFTQGDYAAARSRFDKALALDDTFAESHGALAVLDVVEGKFDSAERRAQVAVRLDRRCLSAALAQSLLASRRDDHQTAERIRDVALNAPLGSDGQTLAQAMAKLGSGLTNRPIKPDR